MSQGLLRSLRAGGLATVVAFALLFAQLPATARADTRPVDENDPRTPVTVAADPLPTVQIDGVAWTQTVVGNTVYVGGKFTTARPAGAAVGVNTVARANLLAYDITTGELIQTWAPETNGDVMTIVPSPDGSRLYIGGSFTRMNGQIRNRIAAIDRATGNLINSFQPKPDATVRAIVATADTVYMGGLLTSVSGTARSRVAAVQASDGAVLSWAPNAQGGSVHSMIKSPDGSKIVIGGAFTTMNGSSNPGYGLAAVDPNTGASLALPANSLVRNAGANAAITGLSSDDDSLYVSGFVFGSGGNLEGVSRLNWSDLSVAWVEDCHGDTYGSFPKDDVIYVSSHAHYCGNLPNGFAQTDPWTMYYGTAFTKESFGTLSREILGYFNWAGNPAPRLLHWLPELTNGTFTGQGQAGWNIAGNDDYVTIGGEFPRAGATGQQGLVRYAVREKAPNKVGPVLSQSKINPTLSSYETGTVRVTWRANWDRDNENLTYKVIRDGVIGSPVHTVQQLSSEWNRPVMSFVDSGLVPGREYRYRIFVSDPYGNEARSDTVYVTAAGEGASLSPYAGRVLDDGPVHYWRFGETPSTTVVDWVGMGNAKANAGVSGGQSGAIIGDADPASNFNGSSNGFAVGSSKIQAPDVFSIEAWVKSSSTAGGKIVGFGSSATGNSSSFDRHIYFDSQGRITFGVNPASISTITSSASYRDGQWHHVVATLGSGGMALYVDAKKVASRTDTTRGQNLAGYWRVGGDNISTSWPSRPSSNYLNGQIDDVAIYQTALSPEVVRQHYLSSGRTFVGATPPADAYGEAVWTAEPDFFWRLAESAGTTVVDASPNQMLGTYNGGNTKGQTSSIGLAGDGSVLFNGSNGMAATQASFTNPSVYTQELWFRTDTTSGGKLIGFGNAATGLSSNYDRHVYMRNDGRLTFGVYTGVENLIESAKAYNDNKWHHVVAMQSAAGMKLYVDAELVGTNLQTAAQDYTGYWRIGGDRVWGGASSNYFRGNIDEVAVYSRALSEAQVLDHFTKGGGQLPNAHPTADFAFTVNKRSVTFDSGASVDTDGTIESYLWDFGDGGTSTDPNPVHVFAGVGSQTVTLTVTDDRSGTGTVTKTVETLANAAPTASFEATMNKLTATFDASESIDTDGTIASYAWDFGDGTTGSGASVTHPYAQAGDYTVTLTVLDDEGVPASETQTVTATNNASPTASFTFTVNDLSVSFDAAGSGDTDGTVVSYAWDFGDGTTGTGVSPTHPYAGAADHDVVLTVTDNDGASHSVTHIVTTELPTGPLAVDTFERTATNGWGDADTGGAWTRYGTANLFAVSGGIGRITLASAGAGPRAALNGVLSVDTQAYIKASLDKVPNGGGAFISLGVRSIGTSDYRAKVKVDANGSLTLYIVRVVNGAETTLSSTFLGSAYNFTVGSTLQIKAEAVGTSPTTLRAKVWKTTQAEPNWQLTSTDSTAALQAAGGVGVVTYLTGSASNAPVVVSFDDLEVVVP